jgi:3-hydroxybutyrate dehydrogenase
MSLAGKVALVTGSTSGIGLGIARALGQAGADLMLNGLGEAGEIRRLCDELQGALGVRVIHCSADLRRPEEISAMVDRAHGELGSLDILVNNAGVQYTAALEEFPAERWDAVIAVNLSAVFHATKAAIPGMKRKRWGRIVNVASAHGLVASAQKVAYVAAKHGVVGMTKVAAIELANTGVTVNAICPGWVLTPLVEAQLVRRAEERGTDVAHEREALLAEKQPMSTFTTPDAIGALAVFLCSEAARTITGAPLPIDGGWTAQ